ncbi:hypothetical protein GCM10010915_28720 [Microbacterium faecale]|uniref:Uncharacterized protein n=1 Tax=Microbacterium faecale TaxID=1804630 RepID=A0A916YJ81_9MICO|nr:hypothetical protein GCM10010915_28720 [Microbacterium faecale]
MGVAVVRADERGQDVHDGGLSRPVRAEKGEDLAAPDVEIDAVEHGVRPESLPQIPNIDGKGHEDPFCV